MINVLVSCINLYHKEVLKCVVLFNFKFEPNSFVLLLYCCVCLCSSKQEESRLLLSTGWSQ